MVFSHLASIFDSLVGNLVTPVASQGLRKLSSLVAVPQAIAAVDKEKPFTGAAQVLASWADAVDIPNTALDCLQMLRSSELVILYQNIAKFAGAASDEETALDTIERFYVNLDRRLLDLAEHERRERNRFETTRDHISSTAAEQTKTLTAEFSQQIQSIRAEVQKLTPVERTAATAKKLAAVEALIDAGQFRAAKTKLDQPQAAGDGSDTVDDVVARSTLEGICLFRLGDIEGSLGSFQRVRALKPTSAVAASNVAAAHLALGDAESALREAVAARALDPSLAPLNYLGALHALDKDAEVLAFLDDEVRWQDDSSFQTAAARIYLETGHVTEAIVTARHAVAITPTVDAKEVLASSLLSQYGFSRSRTPRTVLREVEQLFSECIDERHGWQAHDQLNHLLTNRAVARGLLRDFEPALLDCDSVLAHSSHKGTSARERRKVGRRSWRLRTASGR
jgi:tetratricopeptide (TPR) repeat protein